MTERANEQFIESLFACGLPHTTAVRVADRLQAQFAALVEPMSQRLAEKMRQLDEAIAKYQPQPKDFRPRPEDILDPTNLPEALEKIREGIGSLGPRISIPLYQLDGPSLDVLRIAVQEQIRGWQDELRRLDLHVAGTAAPPSDRLQ